MSASFAYRQFSNRKLRYTGDNYPKFVDDAGKTQVMVELLRKASVLNHGASLSSSFGFLSVSPNCDMKKDQ